MALRAWIQRFGRKRVVKQRVNRAQLAFLAEKRVLLELLMAGRQPRRMNLIWFQRNPLPVDWEAQRQIVKRFEEDA